MDSARAIHELVAAITSSLMDPNPVGFKRADERGVVPVRRACSSTEKRPWALGAELNRNAFLCGCLDFTEEEPIEHVIAGLGRRHGHTTKIVKIAHVCGTAASVSVPGWLDATLGDWLESSREAEVVLFHNHPANAINALFDNLPIASVPDRDTLLGYYLRPVPLLKGLLGGGRARFFVGENGFVREFRTPDLVGILGRLSSLNS